MGYHQVLPWEISTAESQHRHTINQRGLDPDSSQLYQAALSVPGSCPSTEVYRVVRICRFLSLIVCNSVSESFCLFFQFFNYFMCIFAYMPVCARVCEARRQHHIPWNWTYRQCEPSCGCWESNLGPFSLALWICFVWRLGLIQPRLATEIGIL